LIWFPGRQKKKNQYMQRDVRSNIHLICRGQMPFPPYGYLTVAHSPLGRDAVMLLKSVRRVVAKEAEQIRILVVINPELQGRFGDRIRSFGMTPVLVSSALRLAPYIRA
jgi:hypothetical protein